MAGPGIPPEPFAVRDCALVSIATGLRVQNLRELYERLTVVPAGCLYHHFWGTLLRPRVEVPSFRNDFAEWAARGLNDLVLAERLALVDPADHPDPAGLRGEVLEVVEERLDERDHVPWAPPDRQFHFVRSQVVVFDTGRRLSDPSELPRVLPSLPVGAIFFHCVDARRRNPDNADDFREWMARFGEEWDEARARIASVNPYAIGLVELRERLARILSEPAAGGRP